jgi:hypothetical protein
MHGIGTTIALHIGFSSHTLYTCYALLYTLLHAHTVTYDSAFVVPRICVHMCSNACAESGEFELLLQLLQDIQQDKYSMQRTLKPAFYSKLLQECGRHGRPDR